jgi:hypothetical protein
MTGVILTGASGVDYFYTLYPFTRTRWHTDPANYAFVYPSEDGAWRVAYIGETASLFHRMRAHGQWKPAEKLGCAHVLVKLTAGGIRERRTEERDLIARYKPALNTQHLGLPKPKRSRRNSLPPPNRAGLSGE